VAIPTRQLDEIAAAAAEAEHVTRERIFTEYRLRLDRQAVEALSHVGRARRQPDPRAGGGQADHRNSSMTCRSVFDATSPRMHTCAPQPNSIWINPARSTRRRAGRRSGSATISTGNIVFASAATGGAPGRNSRLPLNS